MKCGFTETYRKFALTISIYRKTNYSVGISHKSFTCYNIFHLGYWLSSALDYSLASIVSYILNKRFTFQYKGGILWSLVRFIINIAVCYFIAFGLARPMVRYVLAGLSLSFDKPTLENIAMLLGTGLFVIINFLGQRFFTFRENENSKFTHTML